MADKLLLVADVETLMSLLYYDATVCSRCDCSVRIRWWQTRAGLDGKVLFQFVQKRGGREKYIRTVEKYQEKNCDRMRVFRITFTSCMSITGQWQDSKQ